MIDSKSIGAKIKASCAQLSSQSAMSGNRVVSADQQGLAGLPKGIIQ